MRYPILTLLATGLLSLPGAAQIEGPLRCGMKREYWLAKPDGFDAKRRNWLVVLVHGFESTGEKILWLRRSLATFDDCLFVAPSFPEGFQLLERKTDQQLRDLFAALREKHRLHDKMFVCGFSAGAQFCHRFTMEHPKLVVGCSAHSGGTWGPAIQTAARHIPISLSCGLDDDARSSIGQTLSRVQAAHRYFLALAKKQLHVKARLWRGVGHDTGVATEALISECYQLSTRGLFPTQADELARRLGAIRAALASGRDAAARAGIQSLVPALFEDPPAKKRVRATMNAEQRRVHDVKFALEGLGGAGRSGKAYWIDDRGENEAGWIDNEAAKKHRRRVVESYLEGVRGRLRAR